MKRFAGSLAVLLALALVCGCNTFGRQPQFKELTLAPSELKPGDSAVVSVTVKDKRKIIDKVQGLVREDPKIKFKLNDDGIQGDEKAKDNVWSLQVDVPFQAAPGDFLFEITAYRSDGTPVPVKTSGHKTGPLTATVPVTIRKP